MMTEEQAVTLLSKEDNHEAYSYLYEMYWSKVYNFAQALHLFHRRCKRDCSNRFCKIMGNPCFLEGK